MSAISHEECMQTDPWDVFAVCSHLPIEIPQWLRHPLFQESAVLSSSVLPFLMQCFAPEMDSCLSPAVMLFFFSKELVFLGVISVMTEQSAIYLLFSCGHSVQSGHKQSTIVQHWPCYCNCCPALLHKRNMLLLTLLYLKVCQYQGCKRLFFFSRSLSLSHRVKGNNQHTQESSSRMHLKNLTPLQRLCRQTLQISGTN